MSIEITNLGINSIANAATGGFKIDVASFKLTEANISGPDATLQDVTGVPVYSGTIETIEVISANAVRCWIVIPPGIPTNVPAWSLSEIGIYLTSGALFAHGKLQPVYEKSADFGIRVQVILTAVKLGNVINISLSGLASVPAVAHVYQLPSPVDYPYAVVSVGDAQYNPDRTNSPCTAFKYGDGDASWGFTDHDSVYSGIVYTASTTQIQVENASNGFRLDKDEVVICNFYFGGGYGQTRRYSFDGVKTFYELDGKPVVGAGPTSYVRLWRSNSNNRVSVLSTPGVQRSQFVTNGATDTFPLPVAPISADYVLPFLAGKIQSGFTVAGSNLKLSSIPLANQNLEVCVITMTPSMTESGTILEWKEFEYVGNGVDSQWPIDFQPENIEHVFMFYDGIKQIPGSNYTLGNQHVDSNIIVPNGTKINLAILKRKASKNNNLIVRRRGFSASNVNSVTMYQATDADVLGSVSVWLTGLHIPDSGHSLNTKQILFPAPVTGEVGVVELRPALQFDVTDRPVNSLSITTDNKLKVTRTNGETYQLDLPRPPFVVVPQGQAYGPSAYQDNSLTGFDAYYSPDMPNTGNSTSYMSGFTVMNQGRGAQMAVGWDGELGKPVGAWLRIKDDTKNVWGVWRELAFVDMLTDTGGNGTPASTIVTTNSIFTAPVTAVYSIATVGGGGAGGPSSWAPYLSTKYVGIKGNAGQVKLTTVLLQAGQQVQCTIGGGGIDPTAANASSLYYAEVNNGLNANTSGNGGFTSFGSILTSTGGAYKGDGVSDTGAAYLNYGDGGNGGVANTSNYGNDPGFPGDNGAIFINWTTP